LNVVAIIQARIGSTRLPGKVLKKIQDKVVLDYVIDRLKKCKNITEIVLAITTNKNDDILEAYAKNKKINFIRGSEEDVLNRYYEAAKKFNAEVIVRITSDCPLIDPVIVDKIIAKHLENEADYTTNIIERTYPRGLDTEVFNFDILKATDMHATEQHYREHVTPYIREHPEKFKLQNIEAEGKIKRPDIRITLDTKEDFELISKIISHFDNLDFYTENVIDFLEKNPELIKINQNVKQKEVKNKLNIAFRVDASADIGIGHLMRCLALSEELARRGHACFFVSKTDNRELISKIEKNNDFFQINPSLDLNQDAETLIKFSNEKNIDWIITDHYNIDEKYLQNLKEKDFKVLSIDDNAQIHYFSDVVLNQNIGSEKLKFSSEKDTEFLLGPKYSILRDQLLIRDNKTRQSEVKKILIMLGGTDKDNLILKILKSLKSFDNTEFIVVIGPLNPHQDEIKKYIKGEGLNARVIKFPENMADLYLESDIAISAGGTSSYEFSYFGIPNIIISIADNQLAISNEFDKQNISIYLGKKEQFSSENLKNKVKELIEDSSLRKKLSGNGKKLVDGKGKQRIVEFMEKI